MIVSSAAELCRYWLDEFLDALTECNRPGVTTSYVGAGLVAFDDCCGLLVVSPEQVFRWTTFPLPETDPERCETGLLGVNVLCTLVRCTPTQTATGRPPAASALNAAYSGLLDDSAVLWSRATGAMPEDWERGGVLQTFVGPGGGCVAVETRFTIGLGQREWVCCGQGGDND
jgi:hypothetical protein